MDMSTQYQRKRCQKNIDINCNKMTAQETVQTIEQFKKIISQIPEDRSMSMMFQLMFDMLKLLCAEDITAANFSYALDRMASQLAIANKHDPMRNNAFRKSIYTLGESIHYTAQTLVDKRLMRVADSCDEAIIIPDDQFMSVIVEHCLALLKTVRSKKLIQGNFEMLLESMAADRDVTARHDVMKDSPLRKLVYALSEAIEMTVRILLEKNRSAPTTGERDLNLRNVKAEPVIEEDWSFSDATEPMKDGSGDIVPPSGAILDKLVKPAVEDVPMIVDDDIIPLTDDPVVNDASIHAVDDEVMVDDALEEEESVEYVDEVKAILFEMKEPEEIKEEVDEEENGYEAKENFLDFSHHKDDNEDEEENGAREEDQEEEEEEIIELEQEERKEDQKVEKEVNAHESQENDDVQSNPNEQADRRSKRSKSDIRLKSDLLSWNMIDSSPALSQAKTARKSRQLSCKACGHISQTNRQADNHRLECLGSASKSLHSTQDKTISKRGSKINTTTELTPKIMTTLLDEPNSATTTTPKTPKTDATLRPLRGLICHLLKGHQDDREKTCSFLQDLRYECVCGFAAEEVHQCYYHEKKCAELKEGSLLIFRGEINPKISANQVRPKFTCRCKFTTENKAEVWKHKEKCARCFFTMHPEEAATSIEKFKEQAGLIRDDVPMHTLIEAVFDVLKSLCTSLANTHDLLYEISTLRNERKATQEFDPNRHIGIRNALYHLAGSIDITAESLVNNEITTDDDIRDEVLVLEDDRHMSKVLSCCLKFLTALRRKDTAMGNRRMFLTILSGAIPISTHYDYLSENPLRKVVYSVCRAIEIVGRVLLERDIPVAVLSQRLRPVKEEPVPTVSRAEVNPADGVSETGATVRVASVKPEANSSLRKGAPKASERRNAPANDTPPSEPGNGPSPNTSVVMTVPVENGVGPTAASNGGAPSLNGSEHGNTLISTTIALPIETTPKAPAAGGLPTAPATAIAASVPERLNPLPNDKTPEKRTTPSAPPLIEGTLNAPTPTAPAARIVPSELVDPTAPLAQTSVQLAPTEPLLFASAADEDLNSIKTDSGEEEHGSDFTLTFPHHQNDAVNDDDDSILNEAADRKKRKAKTGLLKVKNDLVWTMEDQQPSTPRNARGSKKPRLSSKEAKVYSCPFCDIKKPASFISKHLAKGHRDQKGNLRFECRCGYQCDTLRGVMKHDQETSSILDNDQQCNNSTIIFYVTAAHTNASIGSEELRYTCKCGHFTNERKFKVWDHSVECEKAFFTVHPKEN